MSSPFYGLNIASSALRAFQRQLDVTGHNIANQNTEGYSRQTVDLSASDPNLVYQGRMIALGSGVNVASVNRIRDSFLDQRRMGVASDQGSLSARYTTLNGVQAVLLEPGDSGVSAALGKFFDAWSSLSSNPGSDGSRVAVQNAGQLLATRVQGLYKDLDSQVAQATSTIDQSIQDIQTNVNAIADLNKRIREQTIAGADANDLKDQRDKAVQKLSGLADIKTFQMDDGTVTVSLNQLTLVDAVGAHDVPTKFDVSTGQLYDDKGRYDVTSGKLGGQLAAAKKVQDYQAKLDTFANTLRTAVNSIYASGTNAAGQTGNKFFNDSTPQTGAKDFTLDAAVSSNPSAIAAGTSSSAGDGGLALQLSKLRDVTQSGLGNKTFQSYYSDFVATIGQDVSFTKSSLDTSSAILTQVDSQIQSVSGVSIDEEMANMLRYQQSYQAAARALSIFNQTTDDLLGILR
jgi:flagellar hook-associated protein 1 FlgK